MEDTAWGVVSLCSWTFGMWLRKSTCCPAALPGRIQGWGEQRGRKHSAKTCPSVDAPVGWIKPTDAVAEVTRT